MHRKLFALAVGTILLTGAAHCWAGPNYYHKAAVHVIPHGVTCKTLPTVASCSDIRTTYAGTGDIDVVPVFFDLKGCLVVEFGLAWPAEWGTCAYFSCIEGLTVGGIVNPGDAIATAWPDCRSDWSISPGYGWILATGPGKVSLVPDPKTNWIGVVNCGEPSQRGYDWPAATFSAGVGGISGDDACESPTQPVKLTITSSVGDRCANPGDSLTVKVAYDNGGSQSTVSNAVLVVEPDPRHSEFVSASPGVRRDARNGDLVWSVASIGPSETGSREAVFRVKASAESTLVMIARLAGDRTPLSADTLRSIVCTPKLQLLQLAISNDLGGACVRPGGRIIHTLKYGNPNTVPVHGAVLTCELPRIADLVSKPSGAVYNSEAHKLTWALGYLEPGRIDSVKVTSTVKGAPGEVAETVSSLRADEPVEAYASSSTAVCGKPSGNSRLKVAIHIMPHTSGSPKVPVVTRSSQINSVFPGTGEIDFVPVFYYLDGYQRLELGLTWPQEWGSCQFTASAGEIRAGGISEPGDGIMLAWGSCQRTWSVSVGSGRLVATGPGRICPVPNPMSKRLGAVNCASPEAGFDAAQAAYCAGVGGAPGK
ncbi:MAG TPA: hypothetical protein VMU02_09185 [bacterium]|nr:hypothetical protein [bacterium]